MASPFPSSIRRVGIIAPAGMADPHQLKAGITQLNNWGIEAVTAPRLQCGTAEKYLSASAADRADDLTALWLDPSVDLLLAVRGGYGCAHLLPLLDWEKLRTRNIPVVGYSDLTALHLSMLRHDAGTPIAGPMAIRMHTIDSYTIKAFHHILAAEPERVLTCPDGERQLEILSPGTAAGPLFAANLAVMATLCGTPWMPDLSGWILLVEDVGEPVYRLDRYLTQLAQSGILTGCRGLIFGGFSDCGEAAERQLLFRRIANEVTGPVLNGFPFGHTFPLASLRQGGNIRIEADGSVYL